VADFSGNPWNFSTADQATSVAIVSIVRNGARSATITTAANTFANNSYVSVQGTGTIWNGGYRIETVVSTTVFLVRIEDYRSTLANLGAVGNVLNMAYDQDIDVTQMLWDSPTTGAAMVLTDRAGRTVWAPTSSGTAGSLTYMKAFPMFGLVINTLPSGTLQISV
jgi:hypothetical protein